jgi:uncharacterized protein (DUF302 family)
MEAPLRQLFLALAFSMFASMAHAADNGIITKPSRYSVNETVERFQAAVRKREAAGFVVVTVIDHAAAGRKFGFAMKPRMLVLFGNPKLGTPVLMKTPLVAIDVPPKALVWEDDQGKIFLSYNSIDYLYKTIYPRRGAQAPANYSPVIKNLDETRRRSSSRKSRSGLASSSGLGGRAPCG